MKSQGMLISAFIFALVIAIFAVINVESVQVNFLFTKTTIPLILIILISTLLGGLTVGLFGMMRIYRLQKTVKILERQVAEQSAEQFQASFSGKTVNVAKSETFSTATSKEPNEDYNKNG